MEIWSSNKTEILPSCSHMSTTIWEHHFETLWEKARYELHNDSLGYFEQILKAADVPPFTSHLTSHPRNMHSLIDSYTWSQPAWADQQNLYQFCTNTGYYLEDLLVGCPIAMDGERESKESMLSVRLNHDDESISRRFFWDIIKWIWIHIHGYCSFSSNFPKHCWLVGLSFMAYQPF